MLSVYSTSPVQEEHTCAVDVLSQNACPLHCLNPPSFNHVLIWSAGRWFSADACMRSKAKHVLHCHVIYPWARIRSCGFVYCTRGAVLGQEGQYQPLMSVMGSNCYSSRFHLLSSGEIIWVPSQECTLLYSSYKWPTFVKLHIIFWNLKY